MDTKALLARMASQREAYVDLPNGRRLHFRRPPEVELPRLTSGVLLDHVVAYAFDWDFTEADLLGAHDGSATPVPFSRELWEAYAKDHAEVVGIVATSLAECVSEYLTRKAAAAKNSAPSST